MEMQLHKTMHVKPKARTLWWHSIARYARENLALWLLALPGIALLIAIKYLPMFGAVVAFQDFRPETGFFSEWVGFRNFELLWNSPVAGRLVYNTLLLNAIFLIATTFTSVFTALLLNEIRLQWFARISQSLLFLPFFVGWSVVSMIAFGMLDPELGTMVKLLQRFGVEEVNFMKDPAAWPWILMAIRIWKDTGSGCILYLAVLAGINSELYEAAAMDGANRLRRMLRISLPLLVPTMILLTLLAIGNIFYGDFGMIYAVVGERAQLYSTTDVIDTYIIRALRSSMNFGMSTAVGLIQSFLGFILVFGSNWLVKIYSRRRGEDYSLF